MGHAVGEAARGTVGGGVVILAIETAVERVGVAVGDHSGPRASAMLSSDRRHAESLAPMIEFVLRQAAVGVDGIDHIAVDAGPGLFTGMRVGMSAAQAMSWALDVPLVPVTSLDAVAWGAGTTDMPVAVALDARRGEVYWALYRAGQAGTEPVLLRGPEVAPPADVAVEIADSFLRHPDEFAPVTMAVPGPVSRSMPAAEHVLALGALKAARDLTVLADGLVPLYLRAPDAEINWQTRAGAR
jgi:tRNA threonylcarbamoyladenosine biosynthesis protein TsaB